MKNIFIQENKEKEKGFTILETLVAIFILVLSLTGPLVFAQSGLRQARLARDQITAFLLAQDAIETIKNIRDTNGLTGVDWLTGLDLCLKDTSGIKTCAIDTAREGPVIETCSGNLCRPLMISSLDQYRPDSASVSNAEESSFKRTIYMNEIVEDIEAQIIVRIDFESLSLAGNRVITVHENIYNWIPRIR